MPATTVAAFSGIGMLCLPNITPTSDATHVTTKMTNTVTSVSAKVLSRPNPTIPYHLAPHQTKQPKGNPVVDGSHKGATHLAQQRPQQGEQPLA